jgi:hypothetical protein
MNMCNICNCVGFQKQISHTLVAVTGKDIGTYGINWILIPAANQDE